MFQLLRPHYITMSEYLLVFLQREDVRFQQLVIATVFNLNKGLCLFHCKISISLVLVGICLNKMNNSVREFLPQFKNLIYSVFRGELHVLLELVSSLFLQANVSLLIWLATC